MRFLMEMIGLIALSFAFGIFISGAIMPLFYHLLGKDYSSGAAVFWLIVGCLKGYIFLIYSYAKGGML